MTQTPPTDTQELVAAISALAGWAGELNWTEVPADARDRFCLLLFDTLAVATAGSALEENRALADAWPVLSGPATALTGENCAPERAAWLNGLAAVSLEMDCASRVTRGHPAAQAFFGTLAAAQERGSSARRTLEALLVGHEVGSRFGRASMLNPGLHPHGNWGTAGAAAGAAYAFGLDAAGIARAIDASGGLMLATAFSAAMAGNPVRNHWAGFTNMAGLTAARAAQAVPDAVLTGPAHDGYALALGALDAAEIAAGLDSATDNLALHTEFLKRHAACGYSHALLDAAMLVRAELVAAGALPSGRAGLNEIAVVDRILLETNETSIDLAGLRCDSRLASMFSLDYLVAAALVLGETGPRATDRDARTDPAILALAQRVEVRVAPDIQARMPLDRGGRVGVWVTGDAAGSAGTGASAATGAEPVVAEVPNARWDPRYFPATWDDVRGKAAALLTPLGIAEQALYDWVQQAAMAADTDPELPLPDLASALRTS